jgi:hypothetical protein
MTPLGSALAPHRPHFRGGTSQAQSGNVQVLGRSRVIISFSQIWNWIGRSVRELG